MNDLPTDIGGIPVQGRQCLFGVTILLIEDSRSTSEAIRLYAAESGARLRRADSLHAANRHLAIYRPQVVIVDLGLPDGDGIEMIRHLASASTPIRAIVATSGADPDIWRQAAIEAGALACLPKPIPPLNAFQDCLLAILPERGGFAPSTRPFDVEARASVQTALEADLRRALALLQEAVPQGDLETVAYCAQFLGAVGGGPAHAGIRSQANELRVRIAAGLAQASEGQALLDLLVRRLPEDPGGRCVA